MNTNIQNICKNYNNIVECEFLDDDVFSKKLVDYYKDFVNGSDLNDPNVIKKIQGLDKALGKYISVENYKFTKKLKDKVDISAVVVDNFQYKNELIEYLISFSDEDDCSDDTVVVQTKWI